MMNKSKIIGIDFDGTCVTHEFPKIGREIGAITVLKELIEAGHKLILHTTRSNQTSRDLDNAIEWFWENNIPLYGVNKNQDQHTWTDSPKPYCNVYVDDMALGCPLLFNEDISDRPFVDWVLVRQWFIENGYLKNKQNDIIVEETED